MIGLKPLIYSMLSLKFVLTRLSTKLDIKSDQLHTVVALVKKSQTNHQRSLNCPKELKFYNHTSK